MALHNDVPPPKPVGLTLTELEREFCLAVISGMPKADAYVHARGTAAKPKQAATNLLKKPKVQAYLLQLMERGEKEAIMKRDEALKMLTNIARSKITDVIAFHEVPSLDINGGERFDRKTGEQVFDTIWTIKNISAMTPEIAAIIKGISNTQSGVKLDMHDQVAALKQLSTMEGWDAAQKHEHTGKDGGAIETRVERIIIDPKEQKGPE